MSEQDASQGARERLDRARILLAGGRAEEASELVDHLLKEQPDHLGVLLLKADLLLEAREGEGALALYRRAVAVAPGSSEALNGLARGLHALGRDVEALDFAEAARRLLGEGDNFRQTAPVYLTTVWCLRELRRLREALAVAEEGLARCPDGILAHWASEVEEELAEAEKERC
jgi:tetratricopeptide (TPR) repeat protein